MENEKGIVPNEKKEIDIEQLPENWQMLQLRKLTDVFELKVENMARFQPAAVEEGIPLRRSGLDFYCDHDQVHYLLRYVSDELNFDQHSVNKDWYTYQYQYKFENEKIDHRLGGPAYYQYNARTGWIKNLKFYYGGTEFTEADYWYAMSEKDNGIWRQDYYKEKEDKPYCYRSDYFFDQFTIQCYKISKRFVYKISKQKVCRIQFYRVLEQRMSRIRV